MYFVRNIKTKKDNVAPTYENMREIPGPKGKLFIGDAIAFDEDPIKWMVEKKQQYGDMIKLDSETIVITCPELISKVFDKTNEDFILDNATTYGAEGRRKLLEGLPAWMESRKFLGKSLNANLLSKHIGRVRESLLKTISGFKKNQQHDLFDVSQRVLGCAIADFCLGSDPRFIEVFDLVEEVFWSSLAVTDGDETRIRWLPRPKAKKAMEKNNELVNLLSDVIHARIACHKDGEREAADPQDLLDELVYALDGVPHEQFIAAVRLVMVTAHGPSGSIFSWALLELKQHPEWEEKVFQELVGKDAQVNVRGQYPITLAFLKEVMRVHPSNWLMGRTVNRENELGGYWLEEDVRILFSPYVIHRDSRYWSDPQTFNPNRWLESAQEINKKAYFPFGAGSRTCPGALLGPIQLILGLQVVLTSYDYQVTNINEVKPSHSTLLRPQNARISFSPKASG